jgi:diguanylate cyclase (GGDEF)-like protein
VTASGEHMRRIGRFPVPAVPPTVRSEQAAFKGDDQASSEADRASALADVAANGRDHAAAHREVVSEARDRAATTRDRAAEAREFAEGPRGRGRAAAISRAAQARARAAADRDLAADDRRRAASDRQHAAMDRDQSATDRRDARTELTRAHTDDLTGAYRRGAGEVALQHEVSRARRTGESLIVAFVDVDGLKATNDRDGHAAGDARLKDVVDAMRSKLRSYEPIVRYGGDEFVCSVAGVELAAVQVRFDEIGIVLGSRDRPGSMSVGLAEMRTDDTLDDLIRRADDALVEARGSPGRSQRA